MKSYKTIKASKAYTREELFEIIKDKPFEAGVPELVGKGILQIIAFPPIGRHQVQINCGGKKITVMAGEDRNQMAKNIGLSTVTKGWSDVADNFSGDRKKVFAQVATTAKEIEQLNL